MKRCRKSRAEPARLAAYRETNPEGTCEQFRDEAASAHEEVVATLERDQGGLCAYCEMDLVPGIDQGVEHFHPKSDGSDGRNWHLDWDNLLLCCRGGQGWTGAQAVAEGRAREPRIENLSCDARKGSQVLDDRLLNPLEVPAFPRLFKFLGDGRIQVDQAECEEAGIEPAEAEDTIDLLGLNCPRLRDARAEVLHHIERTINVARRKAGARPGATFRYLLERYLTQDQNGRWSRFFTLIRWRLRDSAETHLREIGFDG